MKVTSPKELTIYKKAFELALRIFALSKRFPAEERYALTGQIRRSSRSICMSLREAWAKRRYRDHFVSKLTDCDGENGETDTSLDFAKACGYITDQEHGELSGLPREVGKMLGAMLAEPEGFLISGRSVTDF